MEMYFCRPNFSMFSAQSKCNLTEEERSFLDTAHFDVQDADSDDGNFDVDNDFTQGNCAADGDSSDHE